MSEKDKIEISKIFNHRRAEEVSPIVGRVKIGINSFWTITVLGMWLQTAMQSHWQGVYSLGSAFFLLLAFAPWFDFLAKKMNLKFQKFKVFLRTVLEVCWTLFIAGAWWAMSLKEPVPPQVASFFFIIGAFPWLLRLGLCKKSQERVFRTDAPVPTIDLDSIPARSQIVGAKSNAISRDDLKLVKKHVRDGELVSWIGKSNPQAAIKGSDSFVVCPIGLCLISFWLYLTCNSLQHSSISQWDHTAIAFVLVSLMISLTLVCMPLLEYWNASRFIYILTNQRFMVRNLGKFQQFTDDPKLLTSVYVTRHGDWKNLKIIPYEPDSDINSSINIYGVENAEEIAALLVNTLEWRLP